MKWHCILAAVVASLSPCLGLAQNAAPRVYADAGNIYIEHKGARIALTTSEQDADPVLSPSGTFVVYTRQGRGRTVHRAAVSPPCTIDPKPDELRQINVDGTGDKALLTGRKGDAEHQLCEFRGKQFSSDGKRLYFLTPGGPASGALHVYGMQGGDERFVLPANNLLVLSFCPDKYKDDLVVLSRRGFLLGGSYDWYWLFDPAGKKELGPLGPFDNPDDMVRQARGVWCASAH
jgi:hypothetical protein